MSYIHDALKKAQQEKRRVVAECGNRWAKSRDDHVARPKWLAPVLVVCIAVGFSAYSWISSIDELSGRRGMDGQGRVHKAIIMPPSQPARSAPRDATRPVPRPTRPRPSQEAPRAAIPKPAPLPDDSPKPLTEAPQKRPAPAPEKSPSDAPPIPPGEVTYARALTYHKAGDLNRAKRIYEALLEKSPRLVSALNNLGAIYMEEGNPARARVFFEKAIRIDPTFVDPFYNLACLHGTQKDVKRSLFYLKKAVSLNEAARQWAKADKDLKNLRGHREYEEIVDGA